MADSPDFPTHPTAPDVTGPSGSLYPGSPTASQSTPDVLPIHPDEIPTQDDAPGDTKSDGRYPALDLTRGQNVGRYVVLEQLGAGGMGVVYRAYDPDLDRHVALKLISKRTQGDGSHESRLFREAQALARLSHENVVAVHDVGTYEGRIFVTMELIDGLTVNRWLKQEPRSQREILSVFMAAGRGLAAAHAAGLVHRDFKPTNVMVGSDGRVRVLDFGLARAVSDDTDTPMEQRISRQPPPPMSAQSPSFAASALSTPLTADGVLVGTPHYMSPEQFHHHSGSARSDQFCFCLTLWEALVGVRPYSGANIKELLERLESGQPDTPADPGKLPAWIRRILVRGLAPDPGHRYPSMDALLRDLARDPLRRLRKLSGFAAAALLAGAAVAAVMSFQQRKDELVARCDAAGSPIFDVWNDAQRQRLTRAFAASGGAYAGEASTRVASILDAYAGAFRDMSREACRAVWVRGTESHALLDRRTVCLERRRAGLAALVERFATPSLATVTSAVPAALSLPQVSDCADLEALSRGPALPNDARLKNEIGHVRELLAEADAEQLAGQSQRALTLLAPLDEKVRALNYVPLRLEYDEQLSKSLADTPGKFADTEQKLDEALTLAAGIGDDRASARLWVLLLGTLANDLGRPQEALQQRRAAELALARASAPTGDRLRADLAHNLALAAWNAGRNDEALALARAALAVRERALGPKHHAVANTLALIAILLTDKGELDEAAEISERALSVRRLALGENHPYVADSLDNLGVLRQRQQRMSEALSLHEQALSLRERVLGPEHQDVATSLNNVGSVLLDLGNVREAEPLFTRALHIWEKSLPAEDTSFAIVRINLGESALLRGDGDRARTECLSALANEQAAVEPDSPSLAWEYTCIGDADVLTGHAREALPMLERALSLRADADPLERARSQLSLAKALMTLNLDRKRALSLAAEARDTFASAGAVGQLRLKESERLLGSSKAH